MQTAVEWLENELADNLKTIVLKQDYKLMEYLFLKAKEMEREQLKKERLDGYVEGINSASTHSPD